MPDGFERAVEIVVPQTASGTLVISGGRKTQLRRAEARDGLVERLAGPVERLLGEGRGFTDLSVDEIIQEAGVPRSTFYYHFRDKGELLLAIGQRAIERIVEAEYGLYALGPNRSRKKFTEAVRHTVETWLPHVPLMNAIAELSNYNPMVKEQFLAGWAAAQRGVADHIRTGQHEGFVRKDLHPDYVAAWLTWMAERGMGQIVATAEEERLGEIVEALTAVVWHTLYGD